MSKVIDVVIHIEDGTCVEIVNSDEDVVGTYEGQDSVRARRDLDFKNIKNISVRENKLIIEIYP